MIGLRLIVETPRGGDAGHRFLTSRNDTGDSELASVAAEATHNAVGRSYISVSRQVTQRLPNGAVREGAERMILVGLDVDQLQSEQIEQVKSELNKLLPALDTLIASMDWPSGNLTTGIVCEELRNWVAGEVFAHLPLSELTVAGSFHKSVMPRRSMKNWLLIATLVAACGGIIWLSSGRQGGQREGAKDPPPPLPLTNEARVEKLAAEWQCNSEQLLRSLKRASNWNHRREADGLSLNAGLADGEVLEMLNKVEASSPSEQFFVSPAIKDESGFRQFVEVDSSSSVEKIKDLRKWLFSTWKTFVQLKQAAAKANQALKNDHTEDPRRQMLISVVAIPEEYSLGDSFQEPKTPLFDRQDLMIYQLLEDYRKKWSEAGFEREIAEGVIGVATAKDLAQFMADMRPHPEEMHRAIDKSRRNVNKSLDPKVAEDVDVAYGAFGRFIDQLAEYPND